MKHKSTGRSACATCFRRGRYHRWSKLHGSGWRGKRSSERAEREVKEIEEVEEVKDEICEGSL
jgi:hypothetical protein